MMFYQYTFLLIVGPALGAYIIPDKCLPEYRRSTDPWDPLPPECAKYKYLTNKVCRRIADVAFVLDASRSIGNTSFNDERQFAEKILRAFAVGPDRSRFAAITFGDYVHSEFNFNTFTTEDQISAAIKAIEWADGQATMTYNGLRYTHDHVFTRANGDRDDVPDIVILITDGETNDANVGTKTKPEGLAATQVQADRLKAMGVSIFTIGVGEYIDPQELQKAASQPHEKYYIQVSNYRELNTDAIVQRVKNLTCEGIPGPYPPGSSGRDPPGTPGPESPCPIPISLESPMSRVGFPPGTSFERVGRQIDFPPGTGYKRVCAADIMFILDQSASINVGDNGNFRKELDFVNGIIENMDVEYTHISVIKFSDDASIEIQFNQYKTKRSLMRAVSQIKYGGGATYTNKALALMLQNGFSSQNGARPGVEKIGIIITDGGSMLPKPTRSMARKVQEAGVTMFAIGVGKEFAENERDNREELSAIASDPDRDFVFTFDDINALGDIRDMLSARVCRDVCVQPPGPDQNIKPLSIGRKRRKILFGQGCTNLAADIVFLLDKSSSLDTKANFYKELSFVVDLISTFDIGPTTTRIGAISFSTDSQLEFHLDTYGSRQQLQNAIAAIEFTKGNTNMHLAFQRMITEFAMKSSVAKKVAIVLTDGNPTDPYSLTDEIAKAKRMGIEIFAIGIGPSINIEKLEEIASSPPDFYSFRVASIDTLANIRQKLGLRICEIRTPQ